MAGIVAKDPRVLVILTDPETYFDDARRKAWREARADVASDLDRRARRRRNGATRRRRLIRRRGSR